MKVRNGFVSNSSSSSFVVIGSSDSYEQLKPTKGRTYIIGENGKFEFGWGPEIIYDIDSRINWAWIQAQYYQPHKQNKQLELFSNNDPDENRYERMLFEVIKSSKKISNVKVKLSLQYNYNDKDCLYAYIDHQSNLLEQPKNRNIYETYDNLYNFIYNAGSYIHLDNDNH